MTYHYAMSVFYRIDRNPYRPSHRPIMIIALEQADIGILAKMLGSEAGELLQAEGAVTCQEPYVDAGNCTDTSIWASPEFVSRSGYIWICPLF